MLKMVCVKEKERDRERGRERGREIERDRKRMWARVGVYVCVFQQCNYTTFHEIFYLNIKYFPHDFIKV